MAAAETTIEKYNIPVGVLLGEPGIKNARAFGAVLKTLWTPDGFNAYRNWGKGKRTELDPDIINPHFYSALIKVNNLPPDTTQREVEKHWGESLNLAYDLVEYAAEMAIPSSFHYPGQRSELYDRDPDPTKILRVMASDPDHILQRETRRQVALALMIGDFTAFRDSAKLRKWSDGIRDVLKQELFIVPGTHQFHTFAYFDPNQNRVLGFGKDRTPPEEWMDAKELSYWARYMDQAESVHFNPRIKSPIRSTIKALLESMGGGGRIGTLGHVVDNVGSKITVLDGGDEQVKMIMERGVAAIRRGFPDVIVEEKNGTNKNKNRNSAKQIGESWRRVLLHFPDFPQTPYEFIVRTLESELNAEYQIGVAHRQYEVDNLFKILEVLLPSGIYGIDFRLAAAAKRDDLAEILRKEKMVHQGTVRLVPAEQPEGEISRFTVGHFIATRGLDEEPVLYLIEDLDDRGRMVLKNPGGKTFRAYPPRIVESGKIGREKYLGTAADPAELLAKAKS